MITVKKGEPARFHCDAHSETPAEIHWTFGPDRGPLRGDGEIKSLKHYQYYFSVYQEQDDIIIDSADDTNVGEYHCSATNEYGTGNAEPVRLVITDSKLLVLFKAFNKCIIIDEEPPTARVEPRVFNGKPGDRHQFKCHTTGLPEPQVSWTGPNDGPLPDGVTDLGGGVLEISNARKDLEGGKQSFDNIHKQGGFQIIPVMLSILLEKLRITAQFISGPVSRSLLIPQVPESSLPLENHLKLSVKLLETLIQM